MLDDSNLAKIKSQNAFPALLDDVWRSVAEFSSYLATHVAGPELMLITDKKWGDGDPEDLLYKEHQTKTGWNTKHGVYVFFGAESGDVLYVGMTLATDFKLVGPM